MPIPDDIIADMLRGHQERMHGIAEKAVAKAQELGQRLLDEVRSPLELKEDYWRRIRGMDKPKEASQGEEVIDDPSESGKP